MAVNPPPALVDQGQPAPAPTPVQQLRTDLTNPAPSAPFQPATALTPADAAASYQTLAQGYLNPLSTPVQPSWPGLAPDQLSAIQQEMVALQNANPALTKSAPLSPDSKLVKSSMSAGQIAGAVGQETLQQMVVDPFNQFIDTWKRDWRAGLLETLGGVAIAGGLIGLEAVTGGAATPFIFAASAALVAPGMVNAWMAEAQNPTDANLVKALVSTATGVLSVGVPTRWASGLSKARLAYESTLNGVKSLYRSADVADVVRGAVRSRADIRLGVAPEQQLETLAQRPDEIRSQLSARGVDPADKSFTELLANAETLQALQEQLRLAQDSGDEATLAETEQAIREFTNPREETGYVQTRRKVAHDYLFLPQVDYQHVFKPISIDPLVAQQADRHVNATAMAIRQLGSLDLMQNVPIGKGVEQWARSVAGGTGVYATAQVAGQMEELFRALDVSEPEIEQALQAAEEPAVFDAARPEVQYLAQIWHRLQGEATVSELRNGVRSTAQVVTGAAQRYYDSIEREEAAGGPTHGFAISVLRGMLTGRPQSPSRIYQSVDILDEGGVQFGPAMKRSEEVQKYGDVAQQQAAYEQGAPYRAAHQAVGDLIRTERRRAGGWKGQIARFEKKLAATTDADKQAKIQESIDRMQGKLTDHAESVANDPRFGEHAATAAEMLAMSTEDYSKILTGGAPYKRLVTGSEMIKLFLARHVAVMQKAALRNTLLNQANLSMDWLRAAVPEKMPIGNWSNYMLTPEFKNAGHKQPALVTGDIFTRGVGSPEMTARAHGYTQIAPAVGRAGEIGYQPGIFALDDPTVEGGSLAQQILTALEQVTDGGYRQGVAGALYPLQQLGNLQRMVTFVSPIWHAMNVAGRAIGFFLSDPAIAGKVQAALKDLRLTDPEGFHALQIEMSQAGVRHADRWYVTHHAQLLEKERTGQYSWPGALRTLEGPVNHYYSDMLERGFWNGVDQLQATGYSYAKFMLRDRMPNADEGEIRALAAEYSNNLAGMVNPLYVSRLYNNLKGLVWFAPSYWATFLRAGSASIPSSTRIGELLSRLSGGRYVRMGVVPLRAIDRQSRTELTRLMRQWFVTYMLTTATTADMLNVIFGGRHMWENDQGHMFDVNVDKLAGTKTLPGGEVQHAYVSGIPFFRQGADVANALGLGHDYGLAHQMSDPTWQKQDIAHKTLMATGALLDGLAKTGATKVSGPVSAGVGIATGHDISTGSKIESPVGSLSALANLVPGGYQISSYLTQEQELAQRYEQGTPQFAAAQQRANQSLSRVPAQLAQTYLGIPSVHTLGAERPDVSSDALTAWHQQRNQYHDALLNYSTQMFNGVITPAEYVRHKQSMLDKLAQLDADTFGPNSSAGSLAAARSQLAQAYHLNDVGLNDNEWYAQYDAYSAAWEQLLQSASPSTRAAWWDIETSQWTDADYLEWQAKQLKEALASSIDGVGGQHIRAYQSMIYSIPDLTTSQRDQLTRADPYYYQYVQTLKTMGQTSALGAFVNAFSGSASMYSQPIVAPVGLSPQDEAALAAQTGRSVVGGTTAEQLAAAAKQAAHSPAAEQSGGHPGVNDPYTLDAIRAAEQAVP